MERKAGNRLGGFLNGGAAAFRSIECSFYTVGEGEHATVCKLNEDVELFHTDKQGDGVIVHI